VGGLFPCNHRLPVGSHLLDREPGGRQRVDFGEVELHVDRGRFDVVQAQRLQRPSRVVDKRPLRFGGIGGRPLKRRRGGRYFVRHDRNHAAVIGFPKRQKVGVLPALGGKHVPEKLALPPPPAAIGEAVFLIPREQ